MCFISKSFQRLHKDVLFVCYTRENVKLQLGNCRTKSLLSSLTAVFCTVQTEVSNEYQCFGAE